MNTPNTCTVYLNQLNQQSPLYRPSIFWQEASMHILKALESKGFHDFRRLYATQMFFVPTYGFPGNSFQKNTLERLTELMDSETFSQKESLHLSHYMHGELSALSDYRVLKASEFHAATLPDLLKFSESSVGNPQEQFDFEGHRYSRSSLNYLLGLAFLKKHLVLTDLKVVLEIGGGFGTLGEIIYKLLPQTQYIDIDIPPTLCCAQYYLQQLSSPSSVTVYEDVAQKPECLISDLKHLTVLPSWHIEMLKGRVDLFVNFISFQEMEPDIVANYLQYVKSLNTQWILLRNMREGKALRSKSNLGVETPILSRDYLNMLEGYELIEANTWPFGFKTVDGFHSELLLFKRVDEL